MDHSYDHAPVDGPTASGWGLAALLGLLAAAASLWLGDLGNTAVALIGLVTFGVFGVLLGAGGVELTVTEGHGDSHDAHGHGAHGHH